MSGRRSFKSRLPYFLIPLIVILLAISVYYLKNQIVVATVNGQPVMRWTLIRELERQAGAQTLDSLVSRQLLMQEAKKKNVTVTDADIDEAFKRLEETVASQGQELDNLLSLQNMTREDLLEDIRFQLIVEKLVEENVTITDEEVDKFIEENKEFLEENADQVQLREDVRKQIRDRKIGEEAQALMQKLRDEGSIQTYLTF